MPCSVPDHHHDPWPDSGIHTLHIESCETKCGWCDYETKAANNLRVVSRPKHKVDAASNMITSMRAVIRSILESHS